MSGLLTLANFPETSCQVTAHKPTSSANAQRPPQSSLAIKAQIEGQIKIHIRYCFDRRGSEPLARPCPEPNYVNCRGPSLGRRCPEPNRPQPLRRRSPARVRPGRIGPRDLHRAQTDQPRIPAARTAPEDQINVVFFQFYPLKDDRSNLGRGRAGQTEPDGRNDLTGGTRAGAGRAAARRAGRAGPGRAGARRAGAGRAGRGGAGLRARGGPAGTGRGERETGSRGPACAGRAGDARAGRAWERARRAREGSQEDRGAGKSGRREIGAAGTDSGAAATFRQSVAGRGPEGRHGALFRLARPGPGQTGPG
jgi:hypothetical protein